MFLEEIKPYEERIRLAQQGKGRIKPDILKEIREIYDEYVKDPRLNTKTDIGCGNCVTHMVNQLVGRMDRDYANKKKLVKIVVESEKKESPASEGVHLELGSGKTSKELEEGVIGLEVGEEKTLLLNISEVYVVVLTVLMVFAGLLIGFKKIQAQEEEESRKKYLRIANQNKDEYKLEYGDKIYYVKKRDLK